MERFFIAEENIADGQIVIQGDDLKHMRDVLRLEPGHKLEAVLDGQVFLTSIRSLGKAEAILDIIEEYEGRNEARTKISLYQGIAKGSRMDYIIQKGTEIGITEFIIVEMDRSIVRINNDKKKKSRLDRWQKIADESAKQCKRDILPRVRDIISFDEMLEELKSRDNIFIPYEEDRTNSFRQGLGEVSSEDVSVIIGPEGGFAKHEVEAVLGLGGRSISLGPRILRTETAGLVASAIILYELGDI